jgi:hypothetical protein
MESMWKRTSMIDSAAMGRKILEWTLDRATRPTAMDGPGGFKDQLKDILEIKDPSTVTKFQIIDTPTDTVVIKLPPADIIVQARDQYSDPDFPVENYPFPPYYPIDMVKLKQMGITAETLFLSAVGDYTTTECE